MQTKGLPKPNLAIFDTFKTKSGKFTGEARRQRGIIAHLATEASPEMKTRTSIAHTIADKSGMLWQNIYSGIFRDLEEILIPLGVVREGGRLPLRRGPKALQQEGVPYYELTDAGLLVASSLEDLGESRTKILERYLTGGAPDQEEFRKGMLVLLKTTPSLALKIVKECILAYGQGSLEELVPLDAEKMRSVVADKISVEKELIEALITLSDDNKEVISKFIKLIG